MTRGARSFLYWMPRLLGIGLTVFVGLFALDVFDLPGRWWQAILALLVHLLPVYVLVIILVIAWRRPWVGAIFFSLFAVVYLVATGGQQHWTAYLLLCGPLLLDGLLFLGDWLAGRKQVGGSARSVNVTRPAGKKGRLHLPPRRRR